MDAKYLCELLVILSGSRQPRSNVARSSRRLCTSCVQEGGFEGPENGPKQRRINNRLLSYRPQHRGGTVHKYLIVRWFSVFRNCAESALRYKTATFPIHLLCTTPNHSSVHRGIYSPRSVKMYWLSWKVQCFGLVPINKQNHNAGRWKINS